MLTLETVLIPGRIIRRLSVSASVRYHTNPNTLCLEIEANWIKFFPGLVSPAQARSGYFGPETACSHCMALSDGRPRTSDLVVKWTSNSDEQRAVSSRVVGFSKELRPVGRGPVT